MKTIVFLCALAAGCLGAGDSFAHKVIASVYPAGDTIEGEVGFSNGDMASGKVVEVFDPSGAKLGEATTDDNGLFVFKPTVAVAHIFRADLGAGHVAIAEVAAADLPRGLQKGPGAPRAAATGAAEGGAKPAAAGAGAGTAEIAAMIRAEIKPLRKEIAAYKEKNDLQSILGGIGYILGLAGIGFYVAARRRLKDGR